MMIVHSLGLNGDRCNKLLNSLEVLSPFFSDDDVKQIWEDWRNLLLELEQCKTFDVRKQICCHVHSFSFSYINTMASVLVPNSGEIYSVRDMDRSMSLLTFTFLSAT